MPAGGGGLLGMLSDPNSDGGNLNPYEQEAQQTAATMHAAIMSGLGPAARTEAGLDPPNPTAEQEAALVAHNMQLALASQGTGFGGFESPSAYVASLCGDQTPPPYVGGSIQGGMPGVFSPNDRGSVFGNAFTMDAYNDQSGNPTLANNPTGPQQQLSTNNWRLLPPQYRDPNYYLYNGQIIDRRLTQSTLAPKSVLGVEGGTGDPGYLYSGSEPGMWGKPIGSYAWEYGYPGQLGQWAIGSTPTY